ncbi:hypothetical protein [Streptomyces kronopolitis]|uniref:hypothetical protein n=1 Tax=Streptomyces kronopolitis TaxID=1612435 RepID=UPI00342A6756
MKMPKVPCPRCRRDIAAGPVTGRLSKGRIWRHDDPGMLRVPDEPLVSCPGSLSIVDMPLPGRQLEIDMDEVAPADDVGTGQREEQTMALF